MKEEKTISQLASEHGIHPTQRKEWKRIAQAGLPELFSRKGNPVEQLTKAHAEAVEELYAEIGQLTTQVNWLKKIWPRLYGFSPSCRDRASQHYVGAHR